MYYRLTVMANPPLKQKVGSCNTPLVELGGVEPPSESVLTQNSPGADGYFGLTGVKPFPFLWRKPSRGHGLVASLFMTRAKLTVCTFSTNRRPGPGRGPPREDGLP